MSLSVSEVQRNVELRRGIPGRGDPVRSIEFHQSPLILSRSGPGMRAVAGGGDLRKARQIRAVIDDQMALRAVSSVPAASRVRIE